MKVGYARVSTADQFLRMQEDALKLSQIFVKFMISADHLSTTILSGGKS